jgi:hypothetical protein
MPYSPTTSAIATALLASALVIAAPAAHADNTVIGATAVSTNMGSNFSQSVTQVINQSGLDTNYISGVTDFDNFTSTAQHSSTYTNGSWASSPGTTTGWLTFDLGDTYTLNGVAIWAIANSPFQVNGFELLTDTDANPDNGGTTSLGTFNLTQLGTATASAQAFSFSDVSTRYIVLNVQSTYGPAPIAGFSEIAFSGVSVSTVPEPATALLMLSGGSLLAAAARRRRNRAA